MAAKGLKLNIKECEELVWNEILEENPENFTPEFQEQVLNAIRKIREMEENDDTIRCSNCLSEMVFDYEFEDDDDNRIYRYKCPNEDCIGSTYTVMVCENCEHEESWWGE